MDIQITYEGKKKLSDIQKAFASQLSAKQIQQVTARTLNETARKVQGHIRKHVRQDYTMNGKYLKRASRLTKPAKANKQSLYAEVKISYATVPMVAFKHSPKIRRRKPRGITVEIKKGQKKHLKRAFIATMKGISKKGEHYEHTGIFGMGRYKSGRFVYERGKTEPGRIRITELKSVSPFTASTTKPMQKRINEYVEKAMPSRLEHFLEQKIKQIKLSTRT